MSLLALALFVAWCAWPQRPPPSPTQRGIARCLTCCCPHCKESSRHG